MTTSSVEDAVLPTTDHLWIWRELGTAQFGDARLTQRAMTIAQDLSGHPDQSLASIYEGNLGGLHAAYRFYDNPAVTPAKILAPHFEATWDRSGEQPIVLIAQDTTYFNYSSHKAFQGGGPIESLNDKGILVHSALAMTPQGVPLGLVAQKIWARDPAEFRKASQRKRRAFEAKESARWLAEARKAAQGVPDGTLAVIIGDRESDIYEVFAQSLKDPFELLVRSAQNRRVEWNGDKTLLRDAVEASPILGTFVIDVPRKEGHPIRQATLTVQVAEVRLLPPKGRPKDGEEPPTVRVLLAQEIDPPAGIEPIQWILCTTLPVETFEDARRLVEWYTYRWRIERLHFVLKTGGSNVEKIQLQAYDRMVRAIALYSIVAWRILWMTYPVREDPDQPCSVVFSPEEAEALRQVYERQRPKKGPRSQPLAPDHRLTLGEAMHTMAKLGGFLGRKSDGAPGVKTLWRGYRALQLIVLGMQLASSEHLGP